jgi:kinesin family protein 15
MSSAPSSSSSSSSDGGESVRCVVRVRPPNQRELDLGFRPLLTVAPDRQTLVVNSKPEEKRFTFDFCADVDSTQEEMFARVGRPISETCLTGYNGTIFAYGQTGSGKTHTISGASFFGCVFRRRITCPQDCIAQH